MTAEHAWDKGVERTDGSIIYTCKCGETKIVDTPENGADGTALGKGASFIAADRAITEMTEDKDPAGTAFDPLKLRSTKQDKTSITLTWNGHNNAVKYIVYGNQCGKDNKMQMLAETNAQTFQAAELAKGTYRKYIVVALDGANKVAASSRMIHVGTKGGKAGNYKSVTIKVKKGKKFKKAASATVAAGKCTIVAYAQNGVYKVLNVTVKSSTEAKSLRLSLRRLFFYVYIIIP